MNNQQLMDHMASFAEKTFTSEGQVLPMWILVDEKGEHSVYVTPFGSDTEKDLTARLIRAAVKKTSAVRLGFMSETWMASKPRDTPMEELRDFVPSEQPDRREAIMILVEDRFGKHLAGSIEILRDDNGEARLEKFKDMTFQDGPHECSRFANFFDKESVH